MVRAQSRARRAQNFIAEASSLTPGDLVTHIEHGVGRYLGLKAIDALGAPHDCLELQYDGGKLFLPVENIELLTRYGSDEGAQLDRLGGAGWQQRKAEDEGAGARHRRRADQDRRRPPAEIAAAGRAAAAAFMTNSAARFPYQETEDQEKAIGDAIGDLAAGRPMDRLVCGDVGFGKTEVAMRAAFVAAMAGEQVAVVVPTTLLARQHYRGFAERFAGFPLKVRQLSRFVDAKEAKETKDALAEGTVDIVVGTHALLAESISFKRLGLVIVDEEQHFGVVHKERLKNLKADVHVLTLTATPIPRTLQLALSGVRDLSLITTPPIDRLAVRTFVTPFDPLVVREALLREHYRGGQSFFVAPRIADLREAEAFLKAMVPEVKPAVAHGQMSPKVLEEVMTAFYERKVDVLVSTNIVESRPRHSHRQHLDRAARRHVRPVAALPVARPHRPLQAARLCLSHHAAGQEADRHRDAAAGSAAIAGPAGRGLLGRQPRHGHPRRRQSAGRGTVRPCPRSRHRALPGDAGRSGVRPAARAATAERRPTNGRPPSIWAPRC